MKKFAAILCVVLLAAVSLSAVAEGAFTTLVEGKLTLSISPDFPPFENTDDDGNIIGIEPDIMAIIGEKLGLEIDYLPMDFDSALLAPQTGKADAIVSGVTVREDRKSQFDFTHTYVSIHQAIVCKEDADITMDNLGEQMIGVQSGTTGAIYALDDFGEDQVISYNTYSLAFMALTNGQVDCILVDDLVGESYAATIPGLKVVATTYEQEDFAFGVSKGNTALVDAINAVLDELIEDGTVTEIILKHSAN